MATAGDQGDISGKSQDDAQAFFESQQHQYKRAKGLVGLLTEEDRLEKSITTTIKELLQEEPKLAGYETPFEYATDLQFSLPPYEFFLDTDFFKRPLLHCILLERCLELHCINPVDEKETKLAGFSDDELKDSRLMGQIWLLLLVCAPTHKILEALDGFREMKSNSSYTRTRFRSEATYANIHDPTKNFVIHAQDARMKNNNQSVCAHDSEGEHKSA